MKLLPQIPADKYGDFEFNYEFLQTVDEIGDEELDDSNNFHCYWKGLALDVHVVCIKSLLATQPEANVHIWVDDFSQFRKSEYFEELDELEVAIIEVKQPIFEFAGVPQMYNTYRQLINAWTPTLTEYNHKVAYASDIFRFVVLKAYGGVWFDMDMIFLKDLRKIKLKRFVYKWGVQEYGNGALMRLERDNDILHRVLHLNLSKPFYPTSTFDKKNNLDIWMLPTEFFDVIWKYKKYDGNKIKLPIKNFDDLFKPTKEDIDLNFLPGCFTYHWHNHWSDGLPKNSPIERIYRKL